MKHPCSNNQKARIHIAIADLKLTDSQYRDILWEVFKATSSKQLSYAQAEKLIAHFKRLGWKGGRPPFKSSRRPRPARGNVIYLASENQKLKIGELEEQLGWHTNPARLAGFIRRMTHNRKAFVSQLRNIEAARIIEGLKAILAGGRAERTRHEK
jgi:phage gp16-like protein